MDHPIQPHCLRIIILKIQDPLKDHFVNRKYYKNPEYYQNKQILLLKRVSQYNSRIKLNIYLKELEYRLKD